MKTKAEDTNVRAQRTINMPSQYRESFLRAVDMIGKSMYGSKIDVSNGYYTPSGDWWYVTIVASPSEMFEIGLLTTDIYHKKTQSCQPSQED